MYSGQRNARYDFQHFSSPIVSSMFAQLPFYLLQHQSKAKYQAAAALISSSNPFAASPLTTLLVKPSTSFLPRPCFNPRPSSPLLRGLLSSIGVFGYVVRSSERDGGVLDLSKPLPPSLEPFAASFNAGGASASSSTCMYLAEYTVGIIIGIGRLFRFLTGGFFCCVARALAAATIPSGLGRG
jgi:hypothetical protein